MPLGKNEFESKKAGTRLEQVKQFLKERSGVAFTMREIANELGIESANNVASLLKNLEYHGYIKRKRIGQSIYNIWNDENIDVMD